MFNCEGCPTNAEECIYLADYSGHDIKDCPCRMCLVKVVCNDPCKEFEMFSNVDREDYKLFANFKYKFNP